MTSWSVDPSAGRSANPPMPRSPAEADDTEMLIAGSRHKTRTRLVGAVLTLGAAMSLAACSAPAPTGAELWKSARDVHATYWSAISDLELELYNGEWTTPDYGGAPSGCTDFDKYRFELFHTPPADVRIERNTDALAKRVAAWLKEHGWEQIKIQSYTPPVTSVVVSARKPTANVDDLLVDIQDGSVAIQSKSTCHLGDTLDLLRLMFPDVAPNPGVHNPAEKPPFGQLPEPTK